MELPFTVVFEPPSRAELRALLRMRRTWAAAVLLTLAIGTTGLLAALGRSDAVASGATFHLELSSRPSGAEVWLDGRERGRTPLTVEVESGTHGVLLKTRDAADGQYTVRVPGERSALEAVLWRRQPSISRLRPSLPGARLADVRLLEDGGLALSIAAPVGHQLQAWRLAPDTQALEPLSTDMPGTRLAVAPNGLRVAFVGYELGPRVAAADAAGSPSELANVVWLASGDHFSTTVGWRPPLAPGEQLVDASWSPSGDRLLLVSSRGVPDGLTSSRLWTIRADGQAGREVLSLPSDIAPGSEAWSPDGNYVALLAHAGTVNALCLLDLDGFFRYVADLEPSLGPPPAYLPATWSSDSQQVLFVAPHQHPPGVAFGWPQPQPMRALYVASVTDPMLHLIADTEMDFAAWREDGQVVGLGRPGASRSLGLSAIDGSSTAQRLLELPLSPERGYSAAWDLARARLVLASPTGSGGMDYWLAGFGLEGER